MTEPRKTMLHPTHVALGAQMVDFGGWEMPLQYPTGCVTEHLTTRKAAGLFDVSHMGRFIVRGRGALPFLQHTLTNNADALDLHPIGAQYTLIPTPSGRPWTTHTFTGLPRASTCWWSTPPIVRRTGRT